MQKNKNIIFYVLITGFFLSCMYLTVVYGKRLEFAKASITKAQNNGQSPFGLVENVLKNMEGPLAILLLQIIVILFAARIFGYLFRLIGQPAVIGEIFAGIFLGPSILGAWFPLYTAFLFPLASMSYLQFFSQLGLILFMFVIGMELDFSVIRNKARSAIVISHASIIIPYSLGMVLAYFIYEKHAPANIDFLSFSLFIGIAMSITAFPVLARILQERGLTKTRIGTLAIACAAADDITAWCLLATVISIVRSGSITNSFGTIALAVVYIILMLKMVRPLLQKFHRTTNTAQPISLDKVVGMLCILLVSAYSTEVIGIHALFGAFMAGVIMPADLNFRKLLTGKLEHISIGLLLPLFFAFSGLRTQVGLLNSGQLWGICGVVVFIAILGKLGGSLLAAKFVGESWKDSIILGALINTRGLMELIVLNIGFDLGVLSPEIFTMMVLMALFTTFMTSPILDLMNRYFPGEPGK